MMGLWRRLGRDERGVSAVEFALLMPIMLALLMGTVTIFDLFRTAQSAEKGTFTVGDMLSRQTLITESLLNSMLTFVQNTVEYQGTARLRVSSISNTGGKLAVDWSKDVGSKDVAMAAVRFDDVPMMAVGDSVLLTELFVPHRAFIAGFGIDKVTYENRAVHRPRFVGKVAYQ